MTKSLFALVMAGTLLAPHITSALGDELAVSLVKKADWWDKDFASYLPAPTSQAPWLNLDVRMKLPKGEFPLGRQADSIGHLTVRPAPNTHVSLHEMASNSFR